VGSVAEVCVDAGGEEGYRLYLNEVLPLLRTLIQDTQREARTAGCTALAAVAPLARAEDMGAAVLTIALELAHVEEGVEEEEGKRVSACGLLGALAESLGPDLCMQFIIPEVLNLMEDALFKVRKALLGALEGVCRTAGPTATRERILPCFLARCSDEVWGVRKAAVECLPSFSRCVEPRVRVLELLPAFERLSGDVSKWVRGQCALSVGLFFSSLPSKAITPSLLEMYTKTALSSEGTLPPLLLTGEGGVHTRYVDPLSSSSNSGGSGGEAPSFSSSTPVINYSSSNSGGGDSAEAGAAASFCFPGVALALGRSRWGELRAFFEGCWQDSSKRIRKPMAHSLHEIARIVGSEASEADILPAADFFFFRDPSEECRLGAISNLNSILTALPALSRARLFSTVLAHLTQRRPSSTPTSCSAEFPPPQVQLARCKAWRLRCALAAQLSAACRNRSFLLEELQLYVFPSLCALLLWDEVACVRAEAAEAFPHLLARLGGAGLHEEALAFLKGLASPPVPTSHRVLLLKALRACCQCVSRPEALEESVMGVTSPGGGSHSGGSETGGEPTEGDGSTNPLPPTGRGGANTATATSGVKASPVKRLSLDIFSGGGALSSLFSSVGGGGGPSTSMAPTLSTSIDSSDCSQTEKRLSMDSFCAGGGLAGATCGGGGGGGGGTAAGQPNPPLPPVTLQEILCSHLLPLLTTLARDPCVSVVHGVGRLLKVLKGGEGEGQVASWAEKCRDSLEAAQGAVDSRAATVTTFQREFSTSDRK